MRTEKWRYIHYSDGSEELYDDENDPNEWTNLAEKPEFAAKKKELAAFLPKDNQPGIGMSAAGAEDGEAGTDRAAKQAARKAKKGKQ